MPKYQNSGGESAVVAYEIEDDSIAVEFKGGWVYLYNSIKPGIVHVNTMKQLAEAGEGLNSYIGTHVKSNFADKYRGNLS